MPRLFQICFAHALWLTAIAASPSDTVQFDARPFAVTSTRDGKWVFVSLAEGSPAAAIAVLKRTPANVEIARIVPIKAAGALGMAITHDGKLLIVAAGNAIVFMDLQATISGTGDPVVGSIRDKSIELALYLNVTPDDKLLFVSDERGRAINVFDLERARASGFKTDALIGKIPTGMLPIALTFSPDGKWLYTTSESALPSWEWPKHCKAEGRGSGATTLTRPEGAVLVIDVKRAATDPENAVAGRIPAGCSAVRLAISPRGDRIYVTARSGNAVLAFDTSKLLSDPEHAKVATAAVGNAPVPVIVIDGGKTVLAGNSNRFAAATEPQTLTVLDATKMKADADARIGTIPTGAFPREMALSADGHTLFLTNYDSKTLQVIDLDHLPIDRTH